MSEPTLAERIWQAGNHAYRRAFLAADAADAIERVLAEVPERAATALYGTELCRNMDAFTRDELRDALREVLGLSAQGPSPAEIEEMRAEPYPFLNALLPDPPSSGLSAQGVAQAERPGASEETSRNQKRDAPPEPPTIHTEALIARCPVCRWVLSCPNCPPEPADSFVHEALWREYVEMLTKGLRQHVGLSVAHGWKGDPPEVVARASELREALGIVDAEEEERLKQSDGLPPSAEQAQEASGEEQGEEEALPSSLDGAPNDHYFSPGGSDPRSSQKS